MRPDATAPGRSSSPKARADADRFARAARAGPKRQRAHHPPAPAGRPARAVVRPEPARSTIAILAVFRPKSEPSARGRAPHQLRPLAPRGADRLLAGSLRPIGSPSMCGSASSISPSSRSPWQTTSSVEASGEDCSKTCGPGRLQPASGTSRCQCSRTTRRCSASPASSARSHWSTPTMMNSN